MSGAAQLLLDTARRGELHHAIILHGASRDVLRDLAVRVAKTLNCLEGSTGDDCTSCQRIDRRTHPDVHVVEVADEKKMISVEQIRMIVEEATLRPYEGRTKVFIIDPADALSTGGSNSLLKTLEEPTRDTTFVLITRSPDLLLPTIRSRSQSIYIGEERRAALGEPLEATRLRQVAMFESDEVRDSLAEDLTAALRTFAERRDGAALLAAATITVSRDDVKDSMALLAALLCDAAALDERHAIDAESLAAIRAAIPASRLLSAADALLHGIESLRVNADSRLVVEQALSHLVTGGE